jgi:acyl-CoA synthetase (NDP forming)
MNALDPLFRPRTVAIAGASHKPGKVGYELIKNLVEAGYSGDIIPINPKGGEILGYKVYRSISEVDKPIDLLLVALPTKYILDVMKEAGEKGVKSAIVYSAGFAEIGREDLQEELVKTVKKYGTRIIGPNCAGVIYWGHNLNASFSPVSIKGSIGLLSQSGAMTAVISEYLEFKGLGLRLLVSYGN